MTRKKIKTKDPEQLFFFFCIDKDRRPKFTATTAKGFTDAGIALLQESQKKNLERQGFSYLGMIKTDSTNYKQDSHEFLKIYEQLGVRVLPKKN